MILTYLLLDINIKLFKYKSTLLCFYYLASLEAYERQQHIWLSFIYDQVQAEETEDFAVTRQLLVLVNTIGSY